MPEKSQTQKVTNRPGYCADFSMVSFSLSPRPPLRLTTPARPAASMILTARSIFSTSTWVWKSMILRCPKAVPFAMVSPPAKNAGHQVDSFGLCGSVERVSSMSVASALPPAHACSTAASDVSTLATAGARVATVSSGMDSTSVRFSSQPTSRSPTTANTVNHFISLLPRPTLHTIPDAGRPVTHSTRPPLHGTGLKHTPGDIPTLPRRSKGLHEPSPNQSEASS